MLSEPEPLALMNATHDVLAEELGRLERSIPEEMARALDENIFLFSGFKTYHEMNDASRLLRDDDGGFKPFERFLQDVQAIDASYNQNWLYAEYNFATASTQMAAKWADIERDGDEYDLQYRTALDGLVRPEHAALEGITLPPSDKFWNEYYPPNGWNCRCTAVQVLKDKYPTSDSDQACAAGERATTQIGKNGQNKAAMFRFNPGKAGKVFPPKHPYLPKGCGKCSYNKLAYNPNSEKCRACIAIDICISKLTDRSEYEEIRTERGRVFVHKEHGKNERAENERIAKYFAEKYGWEIYLLKRVDGAKSPDSFNATLGCVQEYKINSVSTINSIDSLIRDGKKQADNIVLEVKSDISIGDLRDAINDRVSRSKSIKELTVIIGGKDATYTREQMVSDDFIIRQEDFK